MVLLEGGAEAVTAGATVQAEWTGAVGDGVVVGESQDWRNGELTGESRGGSLLWPG